MKLLLPFVLLAQLALPAGKEPPLDTLMKAHESLLNMTPYDIFVDQHHDDNGDSIYMLTYRARYWSCQPSFDGTAQRNVVQVVCVRTEEPLPRYVDK